MRFEERIKKKWAQSVLEGEASTKSFKTRAKIMMKIDKKKITASHTQTHIHFACTNNLVKKKALSHWNLEPEKNRQNNAPMEQNNFFLRFIQSRWKVNCDKEINNISKMTKEWFLCRKLCYAKCFGVDEITIANNLKCLFIFYFMFVCESK